MNPSMRTAARRNFVTRSNPARMAGGDHHDDEHHDHPVDAIPQAAITRRIFPHLSARFIC